MLIEYQIETCLIWLPAMDDHGSASSYIFLLVLNKWWIRFKLFDLNDSLFDLKSDWILNGNRLMVIWITYRFDKVDDSFFKNKLLNWKF